MILSYYPVWVYVCDLSAHEELIKSANYPQRKSLKTYLNISNFACIKTMMNLSILYIKNMVCNRCIKVVQEELNKAGYEISSIQLGRVELSNNKDEIDLEKINTILNENGFELIDDNKSQLIDAIKTLIIKKIHYGDLSGQNIVWSELISNHVHYEYKYISRLFSAIEGITIEQYVILQKIEKVKELIVYNALSLSEIAWKMGYSSIAHLSSQFKRITGMTPKGFKEIGINHRKPLDKV